MYLNHYAVSKDSHLVNTWLNILRNSPKVIRPRGAPTAHGKKAERRWKFRLVSGGLATVLIIVSLTSPKINFFRNNWPPFFASNIHAV